jgi:transcriptional regulator with XRE-family HTH domain
MLRMYVLNHIHLLDVTTWMALAELSHPGNSIRERRIELGWTQAELSTRSGIPQADISRIENGRLDARWSTIQRISTALAITNEPPRRSLANGGRVAEAPGPPPKKWSAKGTKIAITPAKK